MRRVPEQLELPGPRTRGGKRPGAGRPRKPKGEAGMPHLKRPVFARRFPVHVTIRMADHVWNLRSRRSFRIIAAAIYAAANRFEMRVCAFSVQGNHIHLVIEAADERALGRGMKGFGVRVARGLNKLMERSGRVVADRYHAHVLRTPTEVRHAVHYVRNNQRKHVAQRGGRFTAAYVDPYSSWSREHGMALPAPGTWMLARAMGAAAGQPDGGSSCDQRAPDGRT